MNKNIAYYSQLDALRCLGVVMVLLVHFLPESGLLSYINVSYLHLGVDLFFSISGFLITGILLKTREQNPQKSKIGMVKNFMIRRCLRIFPIFYLFLIGFIFLSVLGDIWIWGRGQGIYYFTYTANILFFFYGQQSVYFNHLWSLCVEEQFYLIWPWFVLWLPLKWIKYVFLIHLLIGLFCGAVFYDSDIRMLPFGNFHTIGIGAMLAYVWHYHLESPMFSRWRDYAKQNFIISLCLFIGFLFFISYIQLNGLVVFFRELGLMIVLFFLLLSALIGWNGYVGKIANHFVVQYIGRISYGLYLYHKPIPPLLTLTFKQYQWSPNPWFLIFLYFAIVFVLAAISFRFIEQPLLNLKKRVP